MYSTEQGRAKQQSMIQLALIRSDFKQYNQIKIYWMDDGRYRRCIYFQSFQCIRSSSGNQAGIHVNATYILTE
jgi:hypothetical protein